MGPRERLVTDYRAAGPVCLRPRCRGGAPPGDPGCEGDFVVLDPRATPLLARRTGQARSLDELLFALIVLGDDRVIEQTVISQAKYAPSA